MAEADSHDISSWIALARLEEYSEKRWKFPVVPDRRLQLESPLPLQPQYGSRDSVAELRLSSQTLRHLG